MDLFRALFSPPRHLLLVLLFLWFGLSLSERRLRPPLNAARLNDLVFYALLGFILGGRVVYALTRLEAFLSSPLSLFSLNLDLFDSGGGLLVLSIVALVHFQRHHLPLWETLDALTPLFASLLVGLSLAHLASGDGFGKVTTLPWAWELWGASRHPTQLYELIASLGTLGAVLRLRPPAPGALFLRFAALTSGWMLFLYAFRGDSRLVFGGLRLEQVLAWLALAVSLFLLERRAQDGSNAA